MSVTKFKNTILINGDCLKKVSKLKPVDAVVTDPPYGIQFMQRQWDHGVPGVAYWKEVLKILKPGGHLLAFGGTRTFHRLACAIEDAGFEIRDCLSWLYGSGFPKSMNVSKAIDKHFGANRKVVGSKIGLPGYSLAENKADRERYGQFTDAEKECNITAPTTPEAKAYDGWGTALKPAWEPIILARKPLEGTVAKNVLEYGTGGINIDECKVPTEDNLNGGGYSKGDPKGMWTPNESGGGFKRKPGESVQPQGRWPANVIHDGSDEVLENFPNTKSGKLQPHHKRGEQVNCYGKSNGAHPSKDFGGDQGSAARFFKCCKFEGEECQEKNQIQLNVDIVRRNLYLKEVLENIAQKAAAIVDNPEVRLSKENMEHFIAATQEELKNIEKNVIGMILSIEKKLLFEKKREKYIVKNNHVKCVATQKQTGIMTITVSHWKSDGSADPVILNIMQNNLGVGEKDLIKTSKRFMYCAKTSKKERTCEGKVENKHPTVKPKALMKYLIKLITPPNGIVLDPFMGSGSTGIAALEEGFKFIGIEKDKESFETACERIKITTEKELKNGK